MTTRYQKSQIEEAACFVTSFIRARMVVPGGATGEEMATAFAALFTAADPNFDKDKFLAACGIPTNAWPNADSECSGSATCVDHPESAG